MIASPLAILAAVERVASRFGPERVVLFGSHAYGTPTVDSDVDLLILKEFVGSPHRQFAEVRGMLDVAFPLDVLVRRPADVADRVAAGDCFLREVMAQGIVLYDAADARVGRHGRGRLRRRSILLQSRKPSRYDPTCFHAQQGAGSDVGWASPTKSGSVG